MAAILTNYIVYLFGLQSRYMYWNNDKILLLEHFNFKPSQTGFNDFCYIYNLSNLVKERTYFRNPNYSSCLDLLLTNLTRCFQNTFIIETDIWRSENGSYCFKGVL